MTKYLIISFFMYLVLTETSAITIKGTAEDYANQRITFLTYSDYITKSEIPLCSTQADSLGNFECSFELNEIREVFTYLGIYRCYLFAEPGKTYQIILPTKIEKNTQDALNPYFEPVLIPLGIKNAARNDINILIKMFNDSYNAYYNKHVINVMSNKDFSRLDAEIAKLMAPFDTVQNSFFQIYCKYRIGLLKNMAMQQKAKSISTEYFNDQHIYYFNPAFMELFNQVYDKYFMFFSRTETGQQLISEISEKKSYEGVYKILARDKNIPNKDLLELVILKNLHDEFYDDRFSRSAMLTILDSMIEKINNPQHIEIAKSIRNKVTRLLKGFEPPDFTLYDQDSVEIGLSDLKGKYVYLIFCASHSYGCLKEYEMLRRLYEKHNAYLEIITIAIDPEYKTYKEFIENSDYPWKFLYYGKMPGILMDYDIRAFPTYYLIDPEGKLAISPAPSPSENFEKYLFETMRANGDI